MARGGPSRRKITVSNSSEGGGAAQADPAPPEAAGTVEDAAVFRLSEQSLPSWGLFAVLLAVVGALVYEVQT